MSFQKIHFLSLRIREAGSLLFSDIDTNNAASYFFVNAYSISLTKQLDSYSEILIKNRRNFIDGKILQVLLNIKNQKKISNVQIRGTDFTRYIFENISEENPIFILGGSRENFNLLEKIFANEYPNVKVNGSYFPPQHNDWNEYLNEAINLIQIGRAHV